MSCQGSLRVLERLRDNNNSIFEHVLHCASSLSSTKVMNFYLSLVMERCYDEAAGLKIYSFSTFFYPKLRGGGGGQAGGHAAVKRWTKAVDLFLYDIILVPLHLGVHWAMAVSDCRLV